MSLESAFASELYHARTGKQLTQAKVAEAAQISVRWYQLVEKGRFLPGSKVMLRLMVFLEIDAQNIRNEEEINETFPVSYR